MKIYLIYLDSQLFAFKTKLNILFKTVIFNKLVVL